MGVPFVHPVGLPLAAAEAGKGKSKGQANLADPGFAALLAMVAVPGVAPMPQPALTATDGGNLAPIAVAAGSDTAVVLTPGLTLADPALASPAAPTTGPDPTGFPVLMDAAAEGATVAALTPQVEPLPADSDLAKPQSEGAEPSLLTPLAPPPPQAAAPAMPSQVAEQPAPAAVKASDLPDPSPMVVEPSVEGSGEDRTPTLPTEAARIVEAALGAARLRRDEPVLAKRSDQAPPVQAAPAHDLGRTLEAPQPIPQTEKAPPLDRLSGTVHVDRLMEVISQSVRTSADGQYTVTLRLYPEHLGEVRLEMHVAGREVQAVMEVANQQVRQAMEARGDLLRQNLSQAGLALTGFDVNTGRQNQSPRERHEALADAVLGGHRSPAVTLSANTAPVGIRAEQRRGGRLDTMA